MEVFVVLWIIFGFATAVVASGKGHSSGTWFGIGLLRGFIGLLIALGIQPTAEFQAQRQAEVERLRRPPLPPDPHTPPPLPPEPQ